MIARYIFCGFLLFSIHWSTPANAQNFGKNKVNYTSFDWHFIPTENFDIYYTAGGYETALITAELAEQYYKELSVKWNYTLQKRIPILVSNSHNDFAQTNVITDIIEESVGGFTELFKNRVVIPYEGSLDKFRHVVRHELTHAIMFDMLYGGILESMLSREYMFSPPLWFAEGLAEHESQYWSTEGDMIMRDGIINNYIPDNINDIYDGYLVYKGGESFFKFIQEEYGNQNRWITGDLLHSLRITHDVDKTFKGVLGKGLEDLSKEWHRQLRTDYWPDVKAREIPEDFATRLTDHTKLQNYLNIDPTFNPTGDKIAFLTDRNDYQDIMIMSALDGRLLGTVVKGETESNYEEMHWLRGGIAWSPDGNSIAFSAKSGEHDAIFIKKADDKGFEKVLEPKMDAIYSPDWSPDGSKILFSGIQKGKLDLFTIDVQSGSVTQLTNDIFDELDPRWSPDGAMIAFASDRKIVPYSYNLSDVNGNYDIFIMQADGANIRRITTDAFNDLSPDWAPDAASLVYTNERNGIVNLFSVNLASLDTNPLTNLLTGASRPRWSPDGLKIAFTCFDEGGWDIYLLKRPLQRELSDSVLTQTEYRLQTIEQAKEQTSGDDVVLLTDMGQGQELALERISPKPYALKFSPDLFNAMAGYSTFMGVGGEGEISLSDILGNHRFTFSGNLYYTLEESNIFASYTYLKHQTNIGISLFHYKTYYYSSNWDIFSDRTYGGSLIASRPFNRFNRLDMAVSVLGIQRDAYNAANQNYYYDDYGNIVPYSYYEKHRLDSIKSITLSTQFVNDTTLWGYTGPVRGRRYLVSLEYSPKMGANDLQYATIEFDYRKYYRLNRKYDIVTRFSGGSSFGDTPRLFFLGGTDNWLNARIASIPGFIENQQSLFFARFPQPLRGYQYYKFYGNKYFLTNLEFRFPFIQYLAFGWPVPLVIGNISGVLFTDVGSVWDKYVLEADGQTVRSDGSFHGAGRVGNSLYLDDIKMSYGVGMRMNLGFAVVRLETAWKAFPQKQMLNNGTEVIRSDPKPVFYLSVGPEF